MIATEGKETEPLYLDAFSTPREAETQIKIVKNPKHKSHPKDVLARLNRCFNRDYSKARGDEGWLVIDAMRGRRMICIPFTRMQKPQGFRWS